jgi:exopolyphosphatase/guanosine-5'-triphosphate,3'-diphosphate pyrophosphatase
MLKKDEISEWKRMENWLKNHKEMETMIGLGGNIRSFLNTHNSNKMKSDSFYKKFKKLNELNTKDKIEKYGFAEDRADIIGFALQIYERIIKQLGIKTIKSTKWGVSDSIAVKTFHEIYSDKISIYEDR